MIAIKRLQSIMWILVIAFGALAAYLVSLRVATERNAVKALERQIYATRANIRYLEVEFSARSSMHQLAEWNARDIRYTVPDAAHYLGSEGKLAALDSLEPNSPPYAGPPVMAAMARGEQATDPAPAPEQVRVPAMIVPVKAEEPKAVEAKPAVQRVRSVQAEPAAPRLIPAVAKVKPSAQPRIVNLVDKADPSQRRAMRLAQLEETLLDMRTPGAGGKATR